MKLSCYKVTKLPLPPEKHQARGDVPFDFFSLAKEASNSNSQ